MEMHAVKDTKNKLQKKSQESQKDILMPQKRESIEQTTSETKKWQ